MKCQIESDHFNVKIKAVGAEICSFFSKVTGKEYIWQADENIWGSHAPVLFPIVGGLKDNKFSYGGNYYSMNRHGFVRRNKQLQIINQSKSKISFGLTSNSETKVQYPFDFEFRIIFELKNNLLKIRHEVTNTDNKDIYFSLGAHPAFNCPVHSFEEYEDYYLEFEEEEYLRTWNLNSEGLIDSQGEVMLNNSRMLKLHSHLFDKDALIFKSLKSRWVKLCSNKSRQKITVRFNDFSSLGIWAKPNAEFVCIEPWLGYADLSTSNQKLEEKEGIIKLSQNEKYVAAYSIEITE